MPYTLTLTDDELDAMDWVGHRYWWGNDMATALDECPNDIPDSWDSGEQAYPPTVTYTVPEHVAWTIRDNLEAEDSWMPCADDELAAKLRAFCDRIV